MSALSEGITPEEMPIPSLLAMFNHGELHCRPDIPNEVYHADRSCVSTSGLKQILRSPAHYQAYLAGANRKETPAMFLGTATHSRLLEPALFEQEYVVAPIGDKRSKEWKAFVIANAHRKILTPDQFATLEGIACSVSQNQSAMARSLIHIWMCIRDSSLNEEAWVDERIHAALTARAGQSPLAETWVERLATATGVPAAHLSFLGQALTSIELPNGATIAQWRDWYLDVLKQRPEFLPQLLRPSTLEAFLGKPYTALSDDTQRGQYALSKVVQPLKLWMSGATLAEIEIGLGTGVSNKLGR